MKYGKVDSKGKDLAECLEKDSIDLNKELHLKTFMLIQTDPQIDF